MAQRRVFYGWVIVGVSAAILGMGLGAMFSLAVFLKPIEESTGWSRGAISSVALLNWLAMGLGSFVWGSLSDRIGTRGVALGGGLLLGAGLVLASQAQALWQFYVAFGIMVGFAVGAFYAPLTSTVTKWFTVQRGLALALVFGFAYGAVMPIYARVTREYFGEKVMGSAYGAVFLVSTLGMGLGSSAGGWIFDHLGSYAWLYLSSTAIGVMAGVLALTFRPPRLLRLATAAH